MPFTAAEGVDPTIPDPTPAVRRVVYPAEVVGPGVSSRKVKAFITDTELWVWDVTGDGVTLIVRAPYDGETSTVPELTSMMQEPAQLVTGPGVFSVRRLAGCGCGSALLRFLPWAPIRQSS